MWPLTTRKPSITDSTLFREASVRPQSVDEENRTAELIWSTGAEVRRQNFREGTYVERLSMDPRHVDLGRLSSGAAPVLNTHRRTSAGDVLGVVVNARVEDGRGIATVRFSERADVEPIWRDVVAGIIRNVSVGYQIHEFKESRGNNGEAVLTATRWEPMEISIVPVPADAAARVRSHEGADPDYDPDYTLTISDIVSLGGGSDQMARDMIGRGLSIDDARKELLQMRDNRISSDPEIIPHHQPEYQRSPMRVQWSGDDPTVRRTAMADAMAARAMPGTDVQGMAREFVGRSIPELCREIMQWHGEPTMGLSGGDLVYRTMAGHHTSSDFKALLADVANKVLLRQYEAAPSAVQVVGRRVTATNFYDNHRVMVSAGGELAELENEHAEIPFTTLDETKESYRVTARGVRFGISFQALVNDQFDVLGEGGRNAAKWSRNTEAGDFIRQLTANGGAGITMSDGKTVFHADHGNLAAAGTALSVDSLGAARHAMRTQKDLDGATPINIGPKYLMVPSALETQGEKVLSEIRATKVDDVNPHAGKLQLVVDSRLDAVSETAWYLAADQESAPTIEYAYLDGVAGPRLETFSPENKLGLMFRVLLFFGVGFVGWRGLYKNPGA